MIARLRANTLLIFRWSHRAVTLVLALILAYCAPRYLSNVASVDLMLARFHGAKNYDHTQCLDYSDLQPNLLLVKHVAHSYQSALVRSLTAVYT